LNPLAAGHSPPSTSDLYLTSPSPPRPPKRLDSPSSSLIKTDFEGP
jgi:hypothetical protein